MAENSGTGATPFLAFLVGGLIVAVAVLGFFVLNGGHLWGSPDTAKISVDVKTPKTTP